MEQDSTAVAGGPAEQRLTAEHVAARVLLEASTFEEAAPRILESICSTFGWEHGACWAIDADGQQLRCMNIWTAAAARFPVFETTSRGMLFKRGEGLPGRVWETAQPAWIPDVTRDRNFPRARIAAREGLHAAFGFPVILRGNVHGVMEFFSREIREPDAAFLSTLATVGTQIGMFIDRRQAQDELDRVFQLSLDMLCVVGFDGHFKRVNPIWERVLGWTPDELLERPFVDLLHPDDREASMAAAADLMKGHELIYFENRYFHKDGTIRWLSWSAVPYTAERVIYAAGRDITERKAADEALARYSSDLEVAHGQLEDQAMRLQRLVEELEGSKRLAEQAAATKSAFLANMSHEIRTPLNGILGMTTLALQTHLSAEQRDYLKTVKSSADALLELINDILDFSKIEARRVELERAPFELRETVGDACRVLALRAAEKGLELAVDIAADVPELLVGDAGRLRQVLLNILGNAIKFTVTGEVILRVRFEPPTDDRMTLLFSVTDTGIGIPLDKQEYIFQAFTQADSSTTRRYGGTGLGLAIARRLVDLMGGELWLDSDEGKGSTFFFSANFAKPLQAPAAEASERAALNGLRVLVVDDNQTNRRILQEMLASWHMEPSAVSDSMSALAALREAAAAARPFQVVITDAHMPDVDGFTLAARIKADRGLAATPIVMLSSIDRPEDVARSRKVGIAACLSKPVKHSDLLEALSASVGATTRRKTAGARQTKVARDPAATPGRPLRILVAEDNPVNRTLVTTLLQKRGHDVLAVEDGAEAVAVLAGGRTFDVALMDVQMPKMGGFEATQAIRERERTAGGHLPIVALTAHAMAGDRERCLAAGMDGYLAKPIDVDELVATVERVEPTDAPAAAPAPAAAGSEPSAIFDERLALAHTGGDRDLLCQLAAMFRTDAAAALRRIKRALDARDGEALRMSAHSLKGSLAAVGSPAGRAAAAELEACGRDKQFDTAARVFPLLGDRVKALQNEFAAAGLIARAPRRQIKARAPARGARRTSRRPAASKHVTKRGRR